MTDLNKYTAQMVDGKLKRWEPKLKKYVEAEGPHDDARFENVSIVKDTSEPSTNMDLLNGILEQLKISNFHLSILTDNIVTKQDID